ncbi:hypothetical protein B7494_g2338 [Chlorociboria aeruginascens]|nr:hypothetical protein B7494_g2338 [Chlorociboria aeruginascens]
MLIKGEKYACEACPRRVVLYHNALIVELYANLVRRIHGGRCNCALKKEHLDPVPESDSDEASSSSAPTNTKRRPRALTAQSEGAGLTILSNGHHKPVHKNNMAHKCGLPYVVPRAHSIHGPSPSGLANRSVDNLPHTSTIDALHSDSLIKDSIVFAQREREQRMVKSEHGSPLLNVPTNLEHLNGQLPPLDLNLASDYSFLQEGGFGPDYEQPLFSAGLSSASIDWSHYDGLEFNSDNFTSYSQPPSFTGFDFGSIDQPALTTTSTSGEISEVEDFGNASDSRPKRTSLLNVQCGSDFDTSDFGGELGDNGYRLSTASSYIGMPQAQILASNNLEALDMEDFMKATSSGFPPSGDVSQHGLPVSDYSDEVKNGQTTSPFDDANGFQLLPSEEENEAFWMNDYPSNNDPLTTSRMSADNVWAQ